MRNEKRLPLSAAIKKAKELMPATLSKGTAVLLVVDSEARVRQLGIDHKELYTMGMKRYEQEHGETPYPGLVIIATEEEAVNENKSKRN